MTGGRGILTKTSTGFSTSGMITLSFFNRIPSEAGDFPTTRTRTGLATLQAFQARASSTTFSWPPVTPHPSGKEMPLKKKLNDARDEVLILILLL